MATPDSGDTTFVLVSAALVLLMTPALSLFYSGFVGERMAISTMLMSFAALSIITIEWSLLTYSLAFGKHPDSAVDPFIGGTVFGAFSSPNALRPGFTIPEHAMFVFQLAFAAVTSAVISGGVCGRITYPAWCIFIAIWHLIVYTPLAHWIFYPGGWLAQRGVLDFAGGLVVETNSGVSAFVLAGWVSYATRRQMSQSSTGATAAAIAAAEQEAWGAGATSKQRQPHNVPFILLGAGLLLFGWLGFNAASGLVSGYLAARAFTNTQLAAAAGMAGFALAETVWGAGGEVLQRLFTGRPSAVGCATGVVVGLVAITPACGFVSQMASLVIGFVTAIIAFHTERALRRWVPQVDDTLACFTGHGVGGMVGIFATGLCASTAEGAPANGAVYSGNGTLLGWQVVGIIVTVLMSAAGTSLAWGLTAGALALAGVPSLVAPQHARDLDASLHGERAYTPTAAGGGGGSLSGGSIWGGGSSGGLSEAAVMAMVRREVALHISAAGGGEGVVLRRPSPLAAEKAAAAASASASASASSSKAAAAEVRAPETGLWVEPAAAKSS